MKFPYLSLLLFVLDSSLVSWLVGYMMQTLYWNYKVELTYLLATITSKYLKNLIDHLSFVFKTKD